MNKEKIILVTVGVIVCLLVLLPMGRLFYDSLTVGGEYGKPTQYTLENYQYVFALEDNEVMGPVLNTFLIGVGSTLIAMLFGVSCAWITARTNTPYRSFNEPPQVSNGSFRLSDRPGIGLKIRKEARGKYDREP